jgi:F-type H+-transporting ATPase subunit delta
MASTDKKSEMSAAFARSLLELAQDQNQAEPVGAELRDLRQAFEADPTFGEFFANPSIKREDRARVANEALASKVSSPLLRNFLKVAGEHDMLQNLPRISESYDEQLDELLGKVEADVFVPQRLSAEQLEAVRQRVAQALKKDAVLHQYVDESLIGGMVLRVGDQVIDGSVKGQLEQMRKRLLSSRPQ